MTGHAVLWVVYHVLQFSYMAGAALLAALALCDHSVTGAVPPRGQMHRVVVFLSGVPSIGPGGMPHATGNAAEQLVLTQVLQQYLQLISCSAQ